MVHSLRELRIDFGLGIRLDHRPRTIGDLELEKQPVSQPIFFRRRCVAGSRVRGGGGKPPPAPKDVVVWDGVSGLDGKSGTGACRREHGSSGHVLIHEEPAKNPKHLWAERRRDSSRGSSVAAPRLDLD
jgi:hypothetical protein